MSCIQWWSAEIEKQVGERVQTVLRDPYLLAAFQKFGAEITRRSSVFHGLDRFLSEQRVRGRVAFEIGTWHGLTAAILSRYFEQVVTVDVAHQPLKHEVLKHLGIRNVICVDIDSNADKLPAWKEYGGRYDLAYLDGNHADDTDSDFELVKDCGRVLFHEAWPWQSPVFELAYRLPRDEVVFGGFGLALWTKKIKGTTQALENKRLGAIEVYAPEELP